MLCSNASARLGQQTEVCHMLNYSFNYMSLLPLEIPEISSDLETHSFEVRCLFNQQVKEKDPYCNFPELSLLRR
jgi:hypothetical protein